MRLSHQLEQISFQSKEESLLLDSAQSSSKSFFLLLNDGVRILRKLGINFRMAQWVRALATKPCNLSS